MVPVIGVNERSRASCICRAEPQAVELHRSVGLELDMPLDKGIAQAVHVLRAAGIETYGSCEGGTGHVFPEPTVRFHGGPGEGFRAYGVAVLHGLPVRSVRRLWTVDDGELTGPVWEMVFRDQITKEEVA